LRRRLSNLKKSEIVDLHLQGLTRDQVARKTRVSAGGVSGVIRGFIDYADSTSTEEAAEEYGVTETVESLRSLAIDIRKVGTSVEELMEASRLLERIEKLIDLDRIEDFIRAGESLSDKAHIEASVRMHSIEERTGRTHDEILAEVERKDARLKEQNEQIQHLDTEIKNLEDRKARLAKEEKGFLRKHKLTMARVERVSTIEGVLSRYKIDLTRLEGLQGILDSIEQAGYDPKEVVELIRKEGTLQAQIDAHAKELVNIQAEATRVDEVVSALEKRLVEAKSTLEKCAKLESMGWNDESLEKALKLAREAGSPEETFSRLELLKPSAEVKAALERTRAETETLKEKGFRAIEEALNRLSALTEKSSSLVNEKIPSIITQTSNLTEKYGKLQDDFGRLSKEYAELQKSLDDAVSWSTLLIEPEKLPGDRMGKIFFSIMFPRLEIWCKGKDADERHDVAKELTRKTMCLCLEDATPVANFMSDPKKANTNEATWALLSFALMAAPFRHALMAWYESHNKDVGASKLFNAQHSLEQFYKEGIGKLN